MYPTRDDALKLLEEAHEQNPGPWREHSLVAADCAERIAARCPDMDADKAYALGLLHDIGRRFSKKHLTHVIDGYRYMTRLGYDEVARVCMSHSFNLPDIDLYIGDADVSEADRAEIVRYLESAVYDDYDLLIQLCDGVAMCEGVAELDERMDDVMRRYGRYPQPKRERNHEIKRYFEQKMGEDLYRVLCGDPTPQRSGC